MNRFLSALMLLAPLSAVRADDPPKVDPYDQSKVPLEVEPPADFKGKRVLIVAGRQSHGPGDHEFFAGSAILANLLKQTPGVFPIMARDGWPKNEKLFDTADCIVLYMDGGGGHPAIKPEHMKIIQKQLARGCGFVNIHYAVEYPKEPGKDRTRLARRLLRNRLFDQPALGRDCPQPAEARDHERREAVHAQRRMVLRDAVERRHEGRDADSASAAAGRIAPHAAHEGTQRRDRNVGVGLRAGRRRAEFLASPAATSTATGPTKTTAAWW